MASRSTTTRSGPAPNLRRSGRHRADAQDTEIGAVVDQTPDGDTQATMDTDQDALPPTSMTNSRAESPHAEAQDPGDTSEDEANTPPGTSPSTEAQTSQQLRDEIASLRAQLQVAQNTHASSAVNTNIARPIGAVGRTFNLRDAMGLANNPSLFKLLRQITRELAGAAGMTCETLWKRQPAAAVARIGVLARQKHDHFKRYPQDWPIEEFLKVYFKNQRAYRNKCDRIARGIPARPRPGGRRNGRALASGGEGDPVSVPARPPASPRQG